MKVTPLDLRQQKFKTVMRGYDRGEVSALLMEAADDYEGAIRDNDRLRQEVAKLEAVLSEHRSQERNLKNTLMTAQKLADEIKDHATQEASLILREAEGRCDLLLQKAQGRLDDVQREIDGLRMKRREVETSIESLIGTLHNTLEFIHEQDARAREEKVLLHRPRVAETAAVAHQAAHQAAHPATAHPAAHTAHPAAHAGGHAVAHPAAQPSAQPAAHTAAAAHPAAQPVAHPAGHQTAQPAAYAGQPAAHPTAHQAGHPAAQPAASASDPSKVALLPGHSTPAPAVAPLLKPHVPLGR